MISDQIFPDRLVPDRLWTEISWAKNLNTKKRPQFIKVRPGESIEEAVAKKKRLDDGEEKPKKKSKLGRRKSEQPKPKKRAPQNPADHFSTENSDSDTDFDYSKPKPKQNRKGSLSDGPKRGPGRPPKDIQARIQKK